MKDCRRIEHLIYLFRDGEVSTEQKLEVLEHAVSCSKCRRILGDLELLEKAILPLKEVVPDFSGKSELVTSTLRRISGEGRIRLDDVLVWLRPALTLFLLAASVLFLALQAQDSMRIAALESRLSAQGEAGSRFPADRDAFGLLSLAASSNRPQSSLARYASADPFALSGLLSLFQNQGGILDDLSRRYPGLSTVTLEDGIDERERKILATEGQAFLRDFEQILREGEK